MMTLREANAADAKAVADVYLGSRRSYVAFAPLAHREEEVREWIERELIPNDRVFVIELKGAIVAMMAFSVRDGASWIEQLYVAPEKTGEGLGGVLIEFAKKELAAPISLYTFQENLGSRRFYERHGFFPTTFSDGAENEERCPDVLYQFVKSKPNESAHPTAGNVPI